MGRLQDAAVALGVTALAPIRSRLGDVSQVASGRFIRLADGAEEGVRAVDVRVAGGIHALVLIDRGMDIGPAWYAGQPLSWESPTGMVHPAYFRDEMWLRSFHGGLMFTAGLQNVGSAVDDAGEVHGLHGRVSNIPARDARVETTRDGDELAIVVSGSVRETTVYGVDLVLHRRLTFPVGSAEIRIHDEIENRGFSPAPLFLLYHINLGYPVVDAGSRLIGPPAEVAGWDDVSRAAEPEHAAFVEPTAGFPVQVFEHRLPADAPDEVTVALVNERYEPTDGIGISVTFDRRQLPRLWQWRLLSEGLYVTGIEPANCGVLGRVAEREAGNVTEIPPGSRLSFDVTIRAAIGAAVPRLAA